MKLPENIFSEGITTSIFIFEAGIPQNKNEIFTCYIQEDGLITVKNQGRQDVKDKWGELEDYWVDVINKQSGDETIKWINPKDSLSYQTPKREFLVTDKDFVKTILNYQMYKNNIDPKQLNEKLLDSVMYDSKISVRDSKTVISIKGDVGE